MRNLNNFPDELFELSGKHLMAMATGFIVFGGAMGVLITHKMPLNPMSAEAKSAQIEQTTGEISADTSLANPRTISASVIAEEWKYPGAITATTNSDISYDSLITTKDNYKKVWQFYAVKTLGSEIGDPSQPKFDETRSMINDSGAITRTLLNNSAQEIPHCTFGWEDQNHLIRVSIQSVDKGTRITTLAYRKHTR